MLPTGNPASSPVAIPPTSPPIPAVESCSVDVDLECVVTADGRDCETIESPSTKTCTANDPAALQVLAFSYQNNVCDPGSNSQGDAATCVDSAPLVEDDVTVECVGLTVDPSTVPPGGIFSVTASGGGPLPDVMDCSIIGPDGVVLQQNTLDVSGNSVLELEDGFGALQLEACNDITCKELVTYRITVIK